MSRFHIAGHLVVIMVHPFVRNVTAVEGTPISMKAAVRRILDDLHIADALQDCSEERQIEVILKADVLDRHDADQLKQYMVPANLKVMLSCTLT